MDVDNTRSWRDWSPAATGVSASPDYVLFFVQGRSNAQVILTDLRVRVHDRRPPVAGTLLQGACGDVGAFRWLEVDLDQDPLRPLPRYSQKMAQLAKGEVADWKLQPIQFPYKVSVSESEPFLIVANTQGCDCTSGMQNLRGLQRDALALASLTTMVRPSAQWVAVTLSGGVL